MALYRASSGGSGSGGGLIGPDGYYWVSAPTNYGYPAAFVTSNQMTFSKSLVKFEEDVFLIDTNKISISHVLCNVPSNVVFYLHQMNDDGTTTRIAYSEDGTINADLSSGNVYQIIVKHKGDYGRSITINFS